MVVDAADPLGEIEQILATSRTNNSRLGITGALMHSDTLFAQALEGPPAAIHVTFERIQRDRRHAGVVVLQAVRADQRLFGGWSMASVDIRGPTAPTLPISLSLAGDDGLSAPDLVALLQELVAFQPGPILAAE
jgi:hypothetical protein